MLDVSELSGPSAFEVDRGPQREATAAQHVSAGVHWIGRCHLDGGPLDMWGQCPRCQQFRAVEEQRARKKSVVIFAVVIATILGCIGGGIYWVTDGARTSKKTAAAISARNDHRLVVYTMSGCSACSMAKTYMAQRNIDYVERRIDGDPGAYAELEALGPVRVPTFVVEDEVMTGFDPRGILLENALARHGMKGGTPPEQ